MKIHHLNCATFCPWGGRAVHPDKHLVCHCLLIETADGLVLVDTGLGTQHVKNPSQTLGWLRWALRPRLLMEETALAQVQKLGFKKEDVRHIILTHLDLDHAGGLSDFPHAQVHVFAPEIIGALAPTTWIERIRYRDIRPHSKTQWTIYNLDGERWYGFDCVKSLRGLPPEILLIPLTGHTLGHCGVAIQSSGSWLLHCGDAYFFHQEIHPHNPKCTPGLNWYQKLMQVDAESRLVNQAKLRDLAEHQRHHVQIFCAHDPSELAPFRSVAL